MTMSAVMNDDKPAQSSPPLAGERGETGIRLTEQQQQRARRALHRDPWRSAPFSW
jgi:hypothetical protein